MFFGIKECFLSYSKQQTGDETLEKLVQEVGKRIGGFRNKEKEIAYSLIASGLRTEPPTYLAVISATIVVAMSSMSMAISLFNKNDVRNDVDIMDIGPLIISILFLGIICLGFIFSIKSSRDMDINHAVYEILSKRP